jgi:hypothetical protein
VSKCVTICRDHEKANHLTDWATRLVSALTVPERRDHQRSFDDGELEHGWAGAVEIDNERPNTSLAPDPSFRSWALFGVGASSLLIAVFVLFATRDSEPAHAAGLEQPPESSKSSELSSEVVAAPSEQGASPAAPSSPHELEPDTSRPRLNSPGAATTLAAGSTAAVQIKSPPPPPASKPSAMNPSAASKPSVASKPPPVSKPPLASKPPSATKPSAASKPPPVAKPTPPLPEPAAPAKPQVDPTPSSQDDSAAALPDVEAWDEADDEAVSEQPAAPAAS